MEKKEAMLVDVSKEREEMEGALRATGISSRHPRTGGLADLSVFLIPRCLRRRSSPPVHGRIQASYYSGRRKPAKSRVGWVPFCVGGIILLQSDHLAATSGAGNIRALSPKKRGPKRKETRSLPSPNCRLEKITQKLEHKLRQAELIIAAQKKIAEIFQMPPEHPRTRRTHEDNRISGQRGECPTGLCCVSGPRASFYRWQNPEEDGRATSAAGPTLALSGEEEKTVLEILHTDRFVDKAPLEVLRRPSGWRPLSLFREDDVPNSGST